MAIKHIFVPLRGTGHEEHVVLCALALAERLKAHVSARATMGEGMVYIDPHLVAMSAEYYAQVQHAFDSQRTKWRKNARLDFDTSIAKTKIPIVNNATCHEASAYWLDEDQKSAASLARVSDLIVVDRPGSEIGTMALQNIEDALFNLRRPVLMVPPNTSPAGRRTAVAWNGSTEAATALRWALDVLQPGSKVTVLQVGDPNAGGTTAHDAMEYLGWHCFEADVRRIPDKPKATGRVLLEAARDAGADMLVMGAYSHSRFREAILGGVTSYMLRESDFPVLLAH